LELRIGHSVFVIGKKTKEERMEEGDKGKGEGEIEDY
jgi:hypothetical protein